MKSNDIEVRVADEKDIIYAAEASGQMEASAIARGTGIAKRSAASIAQKMRDGKAVIAVTKLGKWVGYAYLEVWANGEYVSNSGMIVHPEYRGNGISRNIKEKVFELASTMYPQAKIFSITTAAAMMKMNSRLGFEPVIYDTLPHEPGFWNGCRSCVNYPILASKKFKICLCTAMLYIPGKRKSEIKNHA